MAFIANDKHLYDEYNQLNSFELCHHSQEIIQDLISKTSDVLQCIRNLSIFLLVGDQNVYMQRRLKLEEIFHTFDLIVKRLRVTGLIVHQRKLALDQAETKPVAENQEDLMVLDTNPSNGEKPSMESLKAEREKLKQEIKLKNGYIKLAIDRVNDIIWNINSIQTIKK